MKKILLLLFIAPILLFGQGPGVYVIKADTVRIKKSHSPSAGQVFTAINTSGDGVWANTIGWNLTGNTGTNPAVNFIGTSDRRNLFIRSGKSGQRYIQLGDSILSPDGTHWVNGSAIKDTLGGLIGIIDASGFGGSSSTQLFGNLAFYNAFTDSTGFKINTPGQGYDFKTTGLGIGNYTISTASGSNGQVLTMNGSNVASWQDAGGGGGGIPYSDTTNNIATQSYVNRNAWGVNGNAGTVAGTNFIGTTDGAGLRISANLDSNVLLFVNKAGIRSIRAYTDVFSIQSINPAANLFFTNRADSTVIINYKFTYNDSTAQTATANGTVLTSDANGNAKWKTPAYFDTTKCQQTLFVDNVIACSPLTLSGTTITLTAPITTVWGGDLTGTVSDSITVAKLNGQLPAFYLSRANATGTQLASTISDFASATNTQLSSLNTYTTPTLAQTALGSGKPYILNTTIGIVSVLLLSITP